MTFDDFPQLDWPQKEAKLFEEGGDYFEFSHFGWGDIETQMHGYMEGYKESADKLVEYAIESKNIRILDTFVFPICFLYRQYIELALKNIFISCSPKSKEEKKEIIRKAGHDLEKIWKEVKPLLIESRTEEEIDDINIVEDYIKQFAKLDKSSFSFRYPIDKKELDLIFKEEKRINLANLKKKMNELYNFLDACCTQLVKERDLKAKISN